MYRVEVYGRIKKIETIFQRIGFWDSKDGNACIKRMRIFFFVLYICCPASMVSGALIANDRDESVSLISVGIASSVHVLRFFCIIWRKDEILGFIHEVDSLSTDDQEELNRINKKLEYFSKFAKSWIALVFFGLYAFLAATAMEKKLPFNIGFPLDYRSSDIGFWTAVVFLAIQISYTIVICLFNITIWLLMLIFSIKYEMLAQRMRRLGVRKETNRTTKRSKTLNISEKDKQNFFQQDLNATIETFQTIPDLISRFTSCFSTLFIYQLLTGSMGICGTLYTLIMSSHENLVQSCYYAVLLAYFFFDIFMITYYGNEIKLSSDRLSYSLFESNWMEQSHSCKKCVVILAECVKQPHELVIWKLYKLDLDTFTSILNLAYRMFNILRNL